VAAPTGQHKIEQHHVGLHCAGPADRLLSGSCFADRGDPVFVLEPYAQRRAEQRVVVDKKQCRCGF
jgi:hypothetical protein